jgi:hypothetical protein
MNIDDLTPQLERMLIPRLERIETILNGLVARETVKDYYSTEELARILGKSEFTVREYCRLGRLNSAKRRSGRGRFCSWVVSHAEVQRYQREGLIPQRIGRPTDH